MKTCGSLQETTGIRCDLVSGHAGAHEGADIHARETWPTPTRPLRDGENPVGLHIITATGGLREVYGCYKRPTGLTLCVRSFNREIDEEVKAEDVVVLDRDWTKEACDD